MLPKIARLQPKMSLRGGIVLALCASALMLLPTFHGVAQSQDAVKTAPPPLKATLKRADQEQKPASSTGKNSQESDTPNAEPVPPKPVSKAAAPSVEYLPRPTTEEIRITLALDKPATFDFKDEPLSEVLVAISNQHKINIVFDHPAFDELSNSKEHPISRDVLVNIRVAEISLKNCLKLTLESHGLTYYIADEVLKVTPRDANDAQTVTRIYPVTDLVGDPEDFESLMTAIQQSVARGSWSPGQTGGFGGGFGGGNFKPNAIGGISKVPASGSLVIHHNRQVHDEVLHLLRGLREAKVLPAKQ